MRRSHRSLIASLLLVAAIAAAPGHATTMLPRSVEDLARASAHVVRATTISTHAAWDAQRRIVTTVRLRAIESLSGRIAAGTEFEVQHLGGIVDGIEMTVIGAPEFPIGEEVVLFLAPNGRGSLETVSLAQGKLEVIRDAAGRERLTRRDLEAVEWARGEGPERVRDLGTLRTRVSDALRSAR